MRWGLHAVYLPRENLRHLEEWIAYHVLLGAEFIHLYDNTGSEWFEEGNALAVTGRNKHGWEFDFSLTDDDVADINAEIVRKYPMVTVVPWRPLVDGRIGYEQVAACDHFAAGHREGWCAFIDVDEFLSSPHPIDEVLAEHRDVAGQQAFTLRQARFEDRLFHPTALEITRTFSFDTRAWAPKGFVDLAHYRSGPNIHSLDSDLVGHGLTDPDVIRFNHYNHNPENHRWMRGWAKDWDPSWQDVPYDEVYTAEDDRSRRWAARLDYESFVERAALQRATFHPVLDD